MVGGASKPSPGCAGWDRLNCSSLQYRSALVVARMRNIFLFYFWEEYHTTPNRLKLVQDIARRFRWWRRYLTYSVLDFADSVFGFRNMMVLNIVSELSRFPHFQSRWLRWPNSIELISHFILFAERMTYSCTTVSLQLYNYICYGCTTLELWLYNYKGLSCTTTEFWFLDGINKLR